MTTRLERMKALKTKWEMARPGPTKDAALEDYEAAQRSNIARMEKAALSHFRRLKPA